jgi:hypothetical protein
MASGSRPGLYHIYPFRGLRVLPDGVRGLTWGRKGEAPVAVAVALCPRLEKIVNPFQTFKSSIHEFNHPREGHAHRAVLSWSWVVRTA